MGTHQYSPQDVLVTPACGDLYKVEEMFHTELTTVDNAGTGTLSPTTAAINPYKYITPHPSTQSSFYSPHTH